MGKPVRLLMVENTDEDMNRLASGLRLRGYDPCIRRVDCAASLREALELSDWDIVAASASVTGLQPGQAIAALKESGSDAPFIFLSDTWSEESAASARLAGADYFVSKDNLARFVTAVEHGLADAEAAGSDSPEALAAAQERWRRWALQALIASDEEGLFAFDRDCRITAWNAGLETLFGCRDDQVLGRIAFEAFPFMGQSGEEEFLRDALEGRPAYAKDRPFLSRSGAGGFYDARYLPITGPEGEIAGGLGLVRDVSQRKRLELEREVLSNLAPQLAGVDSLEKIGIIVRAILDEIWEWDACLLSFRRSGLTWFTTIMEIDTYDGFKKLSEPDIYQVKSGLLDPVMRGETLLLNRTVGEQGPQLLRFGDSVRQSASLIYVPVRVRNEVIGILSMQSYTPNRFNHTDVDILLRLADVIGPALRRCEAEKRISSLSSLGQRLSIAATPEEAARIIVSVADELLGWDSCAMDLYSAKHGRVHTILNMDIVDGQRMDLPSPYTEEPPSSVTRRTIQEGGQLILREDPEHPQEDLKPFGDTGRRSASLMFVPVHSSAGVIGVLTIQSYKPKFYDRGALDLLQALADHCSGALERTRAQEELKMSAERLERSNRELQDFAYAASHDLQEPLNKVRAFGDRLQAVCRDILPQNAKDYLERMLSALLRMQTLINDLLVLSRVTAHAQPFKKADMNEVVRDVLSDLELLIEESKAQITVEELPTIDADRTQMRQLMQNLMSNALKFRNAEAIPIVKVSSRRFKERRSTRSAPVGEICQFIVEDNGIGFEEEYAERIFGAFQRLHGRSQYDGSGIGLTVCRKIVERHSGSITAKSKLGEGSTFTVTLPVEQLEREGMQPAPPQSQPAKPAS